MKCLCFPQISGNISSYQGKYTFSEYDTVKGMEKYAPWRAILGMGRGSAGEPNQV